MTYKLTLEFDSKEAAEHFRSCWINDDFCTQTFDYDTEFHKLPDNYLRIKGTGYPLEYRDTGVVVVDWDGNYIKDLK